MLLHRFALATAGLTFVLLMMGGLVHATGSSLACPDWPLCYGQVFPQMVGGVAVEHSHRLVAALVGVLTIAVAVLAWRRGGEDRTLRWLGVAAVALVVFQGVLGGLTVIYRLPMAVSTAHLATSMLFFSTLLYIGWRARPADESLPGGSMLRVERRWVAGTAIAVYLQLVLGALVRHTGSGLACGESPLLCRGELWPSWGPAALHMSHRIVACVVAVAVAVMAVRVLRAARRSADGAGGRRLVSALAVGALVAVALQVGLGVWTVMSYVDPIVVTGHVGGGALLLASTVSLWTVLSLDPARARRRASDRPPASAAALERAGAAS